MSVRSMYTRKGVGGEVPAELRLDWKPSGYQIYFSPLSELFL